MESMKKVLIHFALKYNGNFKKIYNALENKEQVNVDDMKVVLKYKIETITIICDNYPNELKMVENPPFVLFYKNGVESIIPLENPYLKNLN